MKDELEQAKDQIALLKRRLADSRSDYELLKERWVGISNALEAARRATQAEADRADLICYKVRDLLAARAYNEAAAHCAEKLQGR